MYDAMHMHDVHVRQFKHYSEHVRHTVRHTCMPYMYYSVNTALVTLVSEY